MNSLENWCPDRDWKLETSKLLGSFTHESRIFVQDLSPITRFYKGHLGREVITNTF